MSKSITKLVFVIKEVNMFAVCALASLTRILKINMMVMLVIMMMMIIFLIMIIKRHLSKGVSIQASHIIALFSFFARTVLGNRMIAML